VPHWGSLVAGGSCREGGRLVRARVGLLQHVA
jgi:hypothetical protein